MIARGVPLPFAVALFLVSFLLGWVVAGCAGGARTPSLDRYYLDARLRDSHVGGELETSVQFSGLAPIYDYLAGPCDIIAPDGRTFPLRTFGVTSPKGGTRWFYFTVSTQEIPRDVKEIQCRFPMDIEGVRVTLHSAFARTGPGGTWRPVKDALQLEKATGRN